MRFEFMGLTTFPAMVRVRQRFASEQLADVEGTLQAELERSGVAIPRGGRIAIAVGSRGITHLARIVKQVVAWVRSQGAEPFIVPAMGSHGGATAAGQCQVLEGYGLTEAYAGAPIRASMDVVELPRGDLEVPVYFDEQASRADGTIVVNRIKPHTSFHGPHESGLMKMIAIGLGKHAQALAIHRFGIEGLRDLMPRVARQILQEGNIVLGVGIVENAYDQPLVVRAIPAGGIPDAEVALLELARAHVPCLPACDLDMLIVDEMGKDISGLGMDPHVIGRLKIRGQPEPPSPRIKLIIVCDLTEGSHGNAIGMGLADIITRRLFDKIDFQATYENVLTSTFVERGKVPLVAQTDRQAIEFAFRALGGGDPDQIKVSRIRNTLRLDEIHVSPGILHEIERRPEIEVLGPVHEMFDSQGTLCPF